MRSMLKSERSIDTDLNRSKFVSNQQTPNKVLGQIQNRSFEEVIETLNIYLRSAIDLKNNLSLGKTNHLNDHPLYQSINKIDTNEELSLMLRKVQFFIKSCETELKKINKTIQNASVSQIESMGQNYYKVLSFIKDKYAQLLKESYRTLNLENIKSENILSEEDKNIVKQNRKRKLKQISELQREMESLWQQNPKEAGIQDLSEISFNMVRNKKGPNNEAGLRGNNVKKEKRSTQKEQKSFMVTLQEGKSKKRRNLEVLGMNMEDINLRELAKQQLEKQFLAIRVQAYNMYERYMSHQHSEVSESLRFLTQQQEILSSQVEEEAKFSQQIRQQYERLVRELSEIKTINQLIRKRYVIRESIRIDSQEGIYL